MNRGYWGFPSCGVQWDEVMDRVRDGEFGDWHDLRRKATGSLIELMGPDSGHGISSSDINHTIYGAVARGIHYGCEPVFD